MGARSGGEAVKAGAFRRFGRHEVRMTRAVLAASQHRYRHNRVEVVIADISNQFCG